MLHFENTHAVPVHFNGMDNKLEIVARYSSVEPDYDRTTVDLSERENVTVTQVDEAGREHILVLSPEMVRTLIPQLVRWTSHNK